MGFTRELYKLGFEVSPSFCAMGSRRAYPGDAACRGINPERQLYHRVAWGSFLILPIWINISATGNRFRVGRWSTMTSQNTLLPTRTVAANALLAQPLRVFR